MAKMFALHIFFRLPAIISAARFHALPVQRRFCSFAVGLSLVWDCLFFPTVFEKEYVRDLNQK